MEPLEYITLTPQETGKLLAAGSGDAALVYLYMKATGDYTLRHGEEQLHLPAQTLGWAEALIKQLGLLDLRQTPQRFEKDSAPTYTAEAVTAFAAKDPGFTLLQGEVSRRLGRVLTSEELKTLLAIRDYLKMPPEVVSMALTYCLQKTEYYNRTHGTNRTVTIRPGKGVLPLGQPGDSHPGAGLGLHQPEPPASGPGKPGEEGPANRPGPGGCRAEVHPFLAGNGL